MSTDWEVYIASPEFDGVLLGLIRKIRKTRGYPPRGYGRPRNAPGENYLSDEDLTQALKMHLIERQSHFSPQHGSFDAWAYMVAKHKLIDILRAETRRPDKAYGHQVEPYDGASDDATAGWTDGGSEGHFIERSSIRSETHSDLEGLVISLEDIDLLRSHVRSALGRVSAVSVRAWHQFIPMPTWRSWLIEGDFPLDFPDWDFPTLTRAEQLSLLESITGRPRNTLIQALNRAMKVLEQTSFARKLRELE